MTVKDNTIRIRNNEEDIDALDNTLPATAAFTTGFAYELIAIGVAY